jgi:hypothetical protein
MILAVMARAMALRCTVICIVSIRQCFLLSAQAYIAPESRAAASFSLWKKWPGATPFCCFSVLGLAFFEVGRMSRVQLTLCIEMTMKGL